MVDVDVDVDVRVMFDVDDLISKVRLWRISRKIGKIPPPVPHEKNGELPMSL